MSFENNSFEPQKQDIRKFIIMLSAGIFTLLLILGIIARAGNSQLVVDNTQSDYTTGFSDDGATDDSNSTFSDTSWVPSGYNQYDDIFAWRWGTSAETNCSYSTSSCWSIMIVTSEDCPGGVYGEISILDASGVQIDYTNDTTGAVYAGDNVKLTFDTFNESADKARISKLSCRSF